MSIEKDFPPTLHQGQNVASFLQGYVYCHQSKGKVKRPQIFLHEVDALGDLKAAMRWLQTKIESQAHGILGGEGEESEPLMLS